MLVAMATNTLIRIYSVLQDIYGWNVLITSVFVVRKIFQN